MNCLKLSLWSGPRNVSTALMYAFRQRVDTVVVDEPLYGHYLELTGVKHPGDEQVTAQMDRNGERVVQEVMLGPCERPIHFFKNMAHHLVGLDRSFLSNVTNILLTREPREMLPSLSKQIPNPALRDTGLREQAELLEMILAQGQVPVVIDAKELLLAPRGVLKQACYQLDIPFEEAMLQWPAGPKPEDGVWAEHWYHNVHKSSGFGVYQSKTDPFPERLEPLLEECLPYYETLRQYAIEAEP